MKFGDALPAEDPLARWIAVLSMAFNDILFTHKIFVEQEGGEAIYLVRVAASHLLEVADPKGVLGAGIDDWPEVQRFIDELPEQARNDLERLRGTLQDRDTPESLGWALNQMRRGAFHYPHLHSGQSQGNRLELTRILRKKADEEGSIRVVGGTLEGVRLGFADELGISMTTEIVAPDDAALEQLVKDLGEMQLTYLRFAQVAIDHYLRSLPDGTVRIQTG
jgi:uncharacterized protein (DUF934 family)